MKSQTARCEQYLPSKPEYDSSQQYGAPCSYDQLYPPNPQFNAENKTTVVTVQPSTKSTKVTNSRPTDMMGAAVLACLCCCWPIGIFAILAASKANAAADRGDFETANKRARAAQYLIIAAIIFGIIITASVLYRYYAYL